MQMEMPVVRKFGAREAVLIVLAAGLCLGARAESPSGPSFTNSLGLELVRMGPGTFTMGVGTDPKLADAGTLDYDEQPAHQVTLTRVFYVLKGKVTQEDYARSGLPGSATDASWDQAAAFCRWLSRREGRRYRLPTEAEWEYAFKETRSGRQGALDMEGREWVRDWHGVFPVDSLADPTGPLTGTTKVIREGAHRASLSPDAKNSPWELGASGFRVVCVTDPPPKALAGPPPFAQAAIKQSIAPALQGPDPRVPYFTVRFALPIPPENETGLYGPLTGLDQSVMAHQHSPGFEILPNGDALAIYFSAKDARGTNESDGNTRFVQARLRFGAEEWDPPELFMDFKPLNDQSGLLWTEGNTVRFFGGGRGASPWMPFKMATTTNNGATWVATLPHLDAPANDYTAQPIVNAFRAPDGAMYFAMDAAKDQSFLWRSLDNGVRWHDMGGRTVGRHSTIVPLDGTVSLLAIGGKSTSINGWSPKSTSHDWGVSWSNGTESAFPALGGNQRPCLIRLANGHLCFASDSYHRKAEKSPGGWVAGQGCMVGVSTNNGTTWRIRRLPVELPHEADRKFGTLGYATLRQAPNGVIHLLATMTHPCLHYEFNEAWVWSEAGDVAPENGDGVVRAYRESHADGTVRATWSARICSNGRYLLQGTTTSYYEGGQKEYEVTHRNGRKTGTEIFWGPDGTRVWSWTHDLEKNRSKWVHWWNTGVKRIESEWNTQPKARDLDRRFPGLVADGPAYHWKQDGSPACAFGFTNGGFAGTRPLPAPQTSPRPLQTEGARR
jgi:hypothetical protein